MTKKISSICLGILALALLAGCSKPQKSNNNPKRDYYDEVLNQNEAKPDKRDLKTTVKDSGETIKKKVAETAASLINDFAHKQKQKFPPEVLNNLKNGLSKLGQDYDTEMKRAWFNEQAAAYLKLAEIKKSLSFEEMKVFNFSETQAKGDYVNQLDYFEVNRQSYITYNQFRKSATPTERKLIDDVFKQFNISDFKQMADDYDRWRAFFSSRNSAAIDNDAVWNKIQQTAVSRSQGDANKALEELNNLCSKYTELKQFKLYDVIDEKVENVKKQLQEKYPDNFEKQLEELKKMPPAAFNKTELKYDLNKVLFKCDFGSGGSTIGILCRINKIPVILGNKYLIPDSLPAKFDNSALSLSCSKMIVNKKYKVVGFIVDNLPEDIGEIPDLDEAQKISDDTSLSMVLNASSGICVFPVKNNFLDMNRLFDVRISKVGVAYMLDGTSTRAYDNRAYVFRNNYAFSLDAQSSNLNFTSLASNSFLVDEKIKDICAISVQPPTPKLTKIIFNDSLNAVVGNADLKRSPFSDEQATMFLNSRGYDRFIPIKFLSLQTLKNTAWQTMTMEEYERQQAEYRSICKYNANLLIAVLSRCSKDACNNGFYTQGYTKFISSLPEAKGNQKIVEAKLRAFIIYVLQKSTFPANSKSFDNYYSITKDDVSQQVRINKYLCDYFKEQMVDRKTSIFNEILTNYVRYSKTL